MVSTVLNVVLFRKQQTKIFTCDFPVWHFNLPMFTKKHYFIYIFFILTDIHSTSVGGADTSIMNTDAVTRTWRTLNSRDFCHWLKAQSWASAYLPIENGRGRGTKTGYNSKLNHQLMHNIYDIHVIKKAFSHTASIHMLLEAESCCALHRRPSLSRHRRRLRETDHQTDNSSYCRNCVQTVR